MTSDGLPVPSDPALTVATTATPALPDAPAGVVVGSAPTMLAPDAAVPAGSLSVQASEAAIPSTSVPTSLEIASAQAATTGTVTAPVAEAAAPTDASATLAQVPVPAELPAADGIPATGPNAMAVPAAAPSNATTDKESRPTKGQAFLANLFKRPQKPVPAAVQTPSPSVADERIAAAAPAPKPAKPVAQAFVTNPAPAAAVSALPGVNTKNLFALDSREDPDEEGGDVRRPAVQLASAAGLARLSANGIRTQTDRVEVSCFKPELVRMISRIESHYGKPVVVTSGYRSPKGNRKAGGASNSLHMYCAAADIQIEGVGKWQLASYLRSMPGRGGVGTYCHTESVHIDIGSARDWNWRCRKR